MKGPPPEDLSNLSMLELFRLETETQAALLTTGLLDLERGAGKHAFETLMRAAHSIKGAARIVNLQLAVRVAHALEDCFVAAQQGKLPVRQTEVDLLLKGVDLLAGLARRTDASLARWESEQAADVDAFLHSLGALLSTAPPARHRATAVARRPETAPAVPAPAWITSEVAEAPAALPIRKPEHPERVLRVTAESLNRLLGLAGESLVESRWLRPFADSLQRLKRQQTELGLKLDKLRQALEEDRLSERSKGSFNDLFHALAESHQSLTERIQELEMFDRRSSHLSQRLYLEVLRTRMRPFSDGVRRFPRMVRDLARSMGKQVKLEIFGETTQVDRDILERLETPLAHLLRNAVDHGCETTEKRRAAGKPEEASVRLEARHSAGVLLASVSDDGAGVDLEQLREGIVQKGLATASAAAKLSEPELLEHLFLPGFTLKKTVTEVSGRGFGLDIVQNMVKGVRGAIRLQNQPGRGLRVQLQLPLTLSVLRALLVEVAGEPYAFPLTQIQRTLKLPATEIRSFEGRQHFVLGDQQVALLSAHQILECGAPPADLLEFAVVVLSDRNMRYGLVVDRFLGERELVVQPLEARLGKLKDVTAAALMEDGSPVLILDVEDMFRSIESLLAAGTIVPLRLKHLAWPRRKPKRVLAVDDSLIVRELERKLLVNGGFQADVAVDGLDAWNAVRAGDYDLLITDVDMPRMDGIELATRVKQDPRLKCLPVLIVSYKDREQDRARGLKAGADYYLTKASFHDDTLIRAVVDLIGKPEP